MALRLTIFFAAFTSISAINTDCPAHLTRSDHLAQFGSSCYEFIFDQQDDWHTAEKDCVSRHGHLVDLHSYAEQAFIFNAIQILGFDEDKGVWIGLSDHEGEGNWKWTTNRAVTFTNWAGDQPGMIGGLEDCCLLEFSDAGLWHDYPCEGLLFLSQNHGWICEYPL